MSAAGEAATCEFCAIARGESDAEIVCAGPGWVAFFPLEPATPGHTLVIPREHVPHLWLANAELAADLMRAVSRVGRAVDSALTPDGMNLITSAGEAAEQTVSHLHLHVVPRWADDHFGAIWPPKEAMRREVKANLAQQIREACDGAISG